jgi:hypothetical protein
MRPDDVRAFASSLPEVEEEPHFGRPAFRVRGKLFVSVHADDTEPFAIVHVDYADAATAAHDTPESLEEVWRTHGDNRIFVGLKVNLPSVSSERCKTLIAQAWRNKAPKRLAESYGDKKGRWSEGGMNVADSS